MLPTISYPRPARDDAPTRSCLSPSDAEEILDSLEARFPALPMVVRAGLTSAERDALASLCLVLLALPSRRVWDAARAALRSSRRNRSKG